MSFAKQYSWSVATEVARYTVQPLVALVLARLLDPEDFGLVGICLIVMSFLQVFKDAGLGESIIQSKDKDVADFAFTIQLFLGILFVVGLFFAAGPIATYYESPELTWPIRILALTFVISPFVVTPIRVAEKELNFRIAFLRQVVAPVVAGVVSIGLALYGLKYWALIAGNLTGQVVSAIVFLFFFSWRPRFRFRTQEQSQQVRFGAHMLFQGILRWIKNSIAKLCLGKTKGTTQLGYFEVAQQAANIPYACMAGALQKLVFPVLSKRVQEGKEIRDYFLSVVGRLVLFTVPVGLFAAWAAYPAIEIFLGAKWLPMFGIFLACLVIANAAAVVNLNAAVFKAMDKPQILSKFMIVRVVLTTPILIWASFHGINWLAVTWATLALVFGPVNSFLVCRTLGLSFREYCLRILKSVWMPAIALSAIGGAVYASGIQGLAVIAINLLALVIVVIANLYYQDRELFDFGKRFARKIPVLRTALS